MSGTASAAATGELSSSNPTNVDHAQDKRPDPSTLYSGEISSTPIHPAREDDDERRRHSQRGEQRVSQDKNSGQDPHDPDEEHQIHGRERSTKTGTSSSTPMMSQ